MTRASLVAAAGTALFALLAFGTLHAFWIVPIWNRLLGGLPFALVGALAVGWAYAESGRLPVSRPAGGLVFGLGAWLALLPVTAATVLIRLSGLHQAAQGWDTVIELGVAALTTLLIGRWLARGWATTVAILVAEEVLLAVQAGPVPIVNGVRAAGLFLLLAPLYMACGIVHAGLTAWLRRHWHSSAVAT